MPSGLLWLVLSKGSCEGAIVSTNRGHGREEEQKVADLEKKKMAP